MTDSIPLEPYPTRISHLSDAERTVSLAEPASGHQLEPVDMGRGALVFLVNSFVLEFGKHSDWWLE